MYLCICYYIDMITGNGTDKDTDNVTILYLREKEHLVIVAHWR